MIKVTKLDGEKVFINERNIQWIESLPDTAITFLGGARLLVIDALADLLAALDETSLGREIPTARAGLAGKEYAQSLTPNFASGPKENAEDCSSSAP